eukprot:360973-Chlamydomonas_euryale.AAC.8
MLFLWLPVSAGSSCDKQQLPKLIAVLQGTRAGLLALWPCLHAAEWHALRHTAADGCRREIPGGASRRKVFVRGAGIAAQCWQSSSGRFCEQQRHGTRGWEWNIGVASSSDCRAVQHAQGHHGHCRGHVIWFNLSASLQWRLKWRRPECGLKQARALWLVSAGCKKPFLDFKAPLSSRGPIAAPCRVPVAAPSRERLAGWDGQDRSNTYCCFQARSEPGPKFGAGAVGCVCRVCANTAQPTERTWGLDSHKATHTAETGPLGSIPTRRDARPGLPAQFVRLDGSASRPIAHGAAALAAPLARLPRRPEPVPHVRENANQRPQPQRARARHPAAPPRAGASPRRWSDHSCSTTAKNAATQDAADADAAAAASAARPRLPPPPPAGVRCAAAIPANGLARPGDDSARPAVTSAQAAVDACDKPVARFDGARRAVGRQPRQWAAAAATV